MKQDVSRYGLQVAEELGLSQAGVEAVLLLLADSATVPFIARYRKERTGGLDEVQIRAIEERQTYLQEMDERRTTILATIEEQGKLSPELRAQILATTTKAALEDLYLPYKPKRRTRAIIAREKGLSDLARRILAQPLDGDPQAEAVAFVNFEKGVQTVEEALDGARDIVAEEIAENASVREFLRNYMLNSGEIVSHGTDKAAEGRSKFEQYYDYREALSGSKGHRFLAIRRGEREGFLRAEIVVNEDVALSRVIAMMGVEERSPYASLLVDSARDAYARLLLSSIESDVRVGLKQDADREAVDVFASNVEGLLLASPLGTEAVIGIDPGLRTGCKVVALDATGKYLDNMVIYPHTGQSAEAEKGLLRFMARYPSRAIAIGNGTAGRETESFVRKLVASLPAEQRPCVVMISESGASIFSASDLAREEFPDLDLTVRGAISIARRLQDPLAELVKIDPKSIGVGQYQHDVFQPLLKRRLEEVIESCVNRVGVQLNTASAELLRYVAGIGPSVAKKIVAYRDANGGFASRAQLLKVPGLGPKTFEQAAGFIRVRESDNPLDNSAVHPERYGLVQTIARDLGVSVQNLVGHSEAVAKIALSNYVSDDVGMMTLGDILTELQKPGLDPRAKFEPPKFNDDVMSIQDLKVGMILDGVVTNVTNFGAFVDVGVHQDGLVHISALSDKFVSNPADVVSVGVNVRVVVVEVDLARNRIALSCRLGDAPKRQEGEQTSPAPARKPQDKKSRDRRDQPQTRQGNGFANNPFAGLKRS